MSEHLRSARAADILPTGVSEGGGVPPPDPAPEPSQYDLAHLKLPSVAQALGSTPGELHSAMSLTGAGPWTQEEIRAAVDAWRAREIRAY